MLPRIEILDAHMREGVAADFVTAVIQRTNLILADYAPMLIHAAAGAARHIERAAQAALVEHGGAIDIGRIRNVIEREGHERGSVAHGKRLRAGVPRGAAQNAFDQGLQHGLHHDTLATASGPLARDGNTCSSPAISRNLSAARSAV